MGLRGGKIIQFSRTTTARVSACRPPTREERETERDGGQKCRGTTQTARLRQCPGFLARVRAKRPPRGQGAPPRGVRKKRKRASERKRVNEAIRGERGTGWTCEKGSKLLSGVRRARAATSCALPLCAGARQATSDRSCIERLLRGTRLPFLSRTPKVLGRRRARSIQSRGATF